MSFQLRNYQIDLVEGVQKSMLTGNKKVLVQSPAGSGKSITMAEIAKRATDKGNRVLFIVHRRELKEQIEDTFWSHGVNKELCHIGMVQTVTRRLEKFKNEPQIILVDEAHRSLAKTYLRIFDYFTHAYTIGFTATPSLLSGRGLGEYYEDLVIGKSVEWLIENGNLAPYKYYSVDLLDKNKLKHDSTGDFSQSSITEAVGNVMYGDVVSHYKRLADGKKTIIYCHSVESSKEIAKEFSGAGYSAMQVDGKTNQNIRKKAMEDFRNGEITLLVNAELYGEGVDVPDCEAVILLRPTESLSLFIQQTMRAMRYKPNKRAIIIDHVANYTRHGLPDTPRKWTLEERERKGNKKTVSDAIPIKQCPQCMSVMLSSISICECGHEFIAERNMEVEEAELVEITKDFTLQANYIVTKSVDELSTMEELKAYRKAKNYKPGWVYYQAKLKNII